MIDDAELSRRARALSGALEPVAGQVYFAPECHAGYQALGFNGSPGDFNGVAGPDGAAYFTSRGSVMGQVPGEVVAAAFGVFNPAAVIPAVTYGWSLTDAATICQARTDGAVAQLKRLLGEAPAGLERATELLQRATADLRPDGKPLYAGLRSLGLPGDPIGDMWRLADMLREYRGDGHIAVWTTAGYDATEIGLVTELFWGLPPRSYSRTRAWSDADFDAAEERLASRGLIGEGALTEKGRTEREEVERATDRQCRPFIDALDDDVDELVEILGGWSKTIQAGQGYPMAGPQDLAKAASGR